MELLVLCALVLSHGVASPRSEASLAACRQGTGVAGVRACERLLELEQRQEVRAEAHLQAGFKLLELGRCDEAERHYRKGAALAQDDPHFFYRWGQSLECIGRLAEAAEAYRASVRLDPEHGGPVLRLCDVLIELGRLDEARSLLERRVAERPADPAPHMRLAPIYESEGRSDLAVAAFRRALQLSPIDVDHEITEERARAAGWSEADLRNWRVAVEAEKAARKLE